MTFKDGFSGVCAEWHGPARFLRSGEGRKVTLLNGRATMKWGTRFCLLVSMLMVTAGLAQAQQSGRMDEVTELASQRGVS